MLLYFFNEFFSALAGNLQLKACSAFCHLFNKCAVNFLLRLTSLKNTNPCLNIKNKHKH